MVTKKEALDDVQRLLQEWLDAKAIHENVVRQFVSVVPLSPGVDFPQDIPNPTEQEFDEELDEASNNVESAFKRLRDALQRLWAIR